MCWDTATWRHQKPQGAFGEAAVICADAQVLQPDAPQRCELLPPMWGILDDGVKVPLEWLSHSRLVTRAGSVAQTFTWQSRPSIGAEAKQTALKKPIRKPWTTSSHYLISLQTYRPKRKVRWLHLAQGITTAAWRLQNLLFGLLKPIAFCSAEEFELSSR